MIIRRQSQSRGIALIIVMLIILLLTVLAGGFAYSMKVEMRLAQNQTHESDIEWMGRSGVELARYILAMQLRIANEPYDAMNQKWAGGVGVTNELMADITLENNPLGPGVFSIKITDQERKANINVSDSMLLMQAVTLMGVTATDSGEVVDSIQDWIDADDRPHLSGAENEHYLRLPNPYMVKNGPIDDIRELLLVKGITPVLFWGMSHSNAQEWASAQITAAIPSASERRNRLGFNEPVAEFQGGLVDLFTPISSRYININTASVGVLQLFPGIDANIASQIVQLRAGPDGVEGNEDDVPFRNPGEIINVPGINRPLVGQVTRFFSVRSTTFEVDVEARVGNHVRHYVAMLRRVGPNNVQVLYLHSK